MTLAIPKGPRYLPVPSSTFGGVDFLGLRQANLDMMASCLPGISNVTESVRVFSVISFLHARFYERVLAGSRGTASFADYRAFRERVEVLFTWGHMQQGTRASRSVPGTTAKPPAEHGDVELTFKAWNRSYANTGLMAAVQYGPASKTTDGLGFLDPVDGGFRRVTAAGQRLARAIDSQLASIPEAAVLDAHDALGSAAVAKALMKAWDVASPTEDERAAVREALYDPEAVEGKHGLARRSRTLQLAFEALKGGAMTPDEVRQAMTYAIRSDATHLVLSPALREARWHWAVLQVRQAQRFGHECLLPWIEAEVDGHAVTTPQLVQRAMDAIAHDAPDWTNRTIGDIADSLVEHETFDALSAAAVRGDDVCIFSAIERLRKLARGSDGLVVAALRTVFLCARATVLLARANTDGLLLRTGGSERVSLQHWVDTVSRCHSWRLDRFLSFLFETLVLSQHFAVAAMRNDGGTQRLRIAIEEDGLTRLTRSQWVPRVTPDRLEAALRLSADCGLLREDKGRFELDA